MIGSSNSHIHNRNWKKENTERREKHLREQEKSLESRKGPEKQANPWKEVMEFIGERRQGTKDVTRMMNVITGRKDDKI